LFYSQIGEEKVAIGIHLFGQIYWFDFPKTLESQEMLIARLEREAIRRTPLHTYALAKGWHTSFERILHTWGEHRLQPGPRRKLNILSGEPENPVVL